MTGWGNGFRRKAFRFGLVGLANTAVDMAVFALLIAASFAPLAANLISWFVAVSFSYTVNSRWSFERAVDLPVARSFTRFLSLGVLVSLGVSSGALAVLSGPIGVWPAKVLGIVVAAMLNFIAAYWAIENRLPWTKGQRPR